MAEDTQKVETPQADQTVTPDVVTPAIPDPAEELRRKNEQLEKQLADKDKFITDLKSTNETLEARFTQVNRQPITSAPVDLDLQKEASRIMEVAQIDPIKAGEDLANLIKDSTDKATKQVLQNLSPIIEQNTYINEVKTKNNDLIELGLEPSISSRANQLMQSGKTFKEAVDTAITEARTKVDKLKSNVSVPITPAPKEAVVESGANKQPEPPKPPVEETDEDEIRKEQERRRKMGL